MDADGQRELFGDVSTAHVADACMRLGIAVRHGPADLRPLGSGIELVGRARPVRHAGSVDVFLEALEYAVAGEVLVVDNGGRRDEACVGDLVALEVCQAGLAGLLVWGLHRDTAQLRAIGLPVYSLGALPVGPRELDRHHPGTGTEPVVGEHPITTDDLVVADDDGILFLPLEHAEAISRTAAAIRDTERRQADRSLAGTSLRTQTDFSGYLEARRDDPTLTFREHLRARSAEIEQ